MKPFRIVIAGVGGQGSLTAGRLIAEAALADGKNVLASEIHGMSQRGGIVESTVVIGDVKSPMVAAGQADLLMSFEPVEALRCIDFASRRTLAPQMDEILAGIKKYVGRLVAFDTVELANKAGSARTINAVLIGALSATGVLPVDPEVLERTDLERIPQKARAYNERAYQLGRRAAERT